MATLILTAVGTAVGGPLGGAIGAVIGQQADAAIFAPKGRQGPRLGDLAVQMSSYGSAIPKLFGRMRVAGTVVWATDLRETSSTSGGGKGSSGTTSYSYSASFAVVISGRRLMDVRRIWADGKLLRGEAGDFKSSTGYRLYLGNEEQEVDPLIASIEGRGQTPAYRGLAYAVFEDFQLADYGNRIPSLTFEVEADVGEVAIGDMAAELSGDAVAGGETPAVTGYAASGDSIRAALEALAQLTPLSLIEDEDGLTVTAGESAPVPMAESGTGARAGLSASGQSARTEIVRRAAGTVPAEVSIAYHDSGRDYQTGLQRAVNGGSSHRAERLAVPATLAAGAAKAFAERRLGALWAGRASAKVRLGWRSARIRPGAQLRLEGQPGVWKVERWSFEQMVVTLEAVRTSGRDLPFAPEASPGRSIGHPDVSHGPTTIEIFDLPLYGDRPADKPQLLVAAAGGEAWRKADLAVSYDGGDSWQALGPTGMPSVMGQALTALGPGGSALIDELSSVEVELVNDAMWLEGRSDAALVAGANLALLGRELFQFGEAEPLGAGRFRLKRLLRGRLGTEWAAEGHEAGEPFLLIDPGNGRMIEPSIGLIGAQAQIVAKGLGDGPEGVVASCAITGEALRPPAPVHLRAERQGNGDIKLAWTRRSRSGWNWLSGSDTPLGEESESYLLTLIGAGFRRTETLTQPSYLYIAQRQAEDGLSGPLSINVVQIGTAAQSRSTQILFE